MDNRQTFQRIDQYVELRRAEVRNPAMAIALTDRERTAYVGTYGATDPQDGDTITADTPFEIGSVSKMFGAVVALQAHEAGLLDLHAPVTTYLPWFEVRSPYEAPITVHHLLSHSAGLVYSMDASPDPRGAVWGLRNVAVGFMPGEHHTYSEPGYQTLTLVLEKIYGKPYAQIVRDGILHPLAMTHSSAAITHDLRPRMPRGYQTLFDDRPPHSSHPLVPAAWIEFNSSDGAIVSTAADMTKFARMLLNCGRGPSGAVLSEESFARMITEAVVGSQYGYGIYTIPKDGYRRIGHGGDMPGYEAYVFADLDRGLGTVVLAAQPYPSGLWMRVHEYWRAAEMGAALPELTPPADPACVDNAADYAGTYRAGEKVLTVLHAQGRLTLNPGGERIALERRGEDRFYANHPDWQLFLLAFGRAAAQGDAPGPVVELAHGEDWYAGERYDGPRTFPHPPEWDAIAGHYRTHNPWLTNFRVVVRKGKLWFVWPWGDEDPLAPLDDGSFRLGWDAYSPERLRFDQIADGLALRATLSGCHYYRFFTP